MVLRKNVFEVMANVISATFFGTRPVPFSQWYVFIKWQNMLGQKQYTKGQRQDNSVGSYQRLPLQKPKTIVFYSILKLCSNINIVSVGLIRAEQYKFEWFCKGHFVCLFSQQLSLTKSSWSLSFNFKDHDLTEQWTFSHLSTKWSRTPPLHSK